MIISALIIAVILVIPALREFFSLTTLNANEWMIVLALALLPLFLVEVTKLIKRKFKVY